MAKKGHPSARKPKKPATAGTGGHGRRALEGKGPDPKAEDRSWHPAGSGKQRKSASSQHGLVMALLLVPRRDQCDPSLRTLSWSRDETP